jgi:putative endonuclease
VRGLTGEHAALAYLTSCGWSLEAHRFRLGRHDIDLVMRLGKTVAFIEVKTRSGDGFGSPVEAIGSRKQANIARVAEIWRLRFGRPDDQYRFDTVVVRQQPGRAPVVEHLPDAWRGGGQGRS